MHDDVSFFDQRKCQTDHESLYTEIYLPAGQDDLLFRQPGDLTDPAAAGFAGLRDPYTSAGDLILLFPDLPDPVLVGRGLVFIGTHGLFQGHTVLMERPDPDLDVCDADLLSGGDHPGEI